MPTSKTVNLKLWRQNFERVAAVQGEDKARVLSMVISEREGVPFDMSGYTAEIYMHEANGRDVTLPAEIDGNIVTAVVPLITAAGDAAIQVILTKSTGEILKVAGLVLDVQPSELENAVDGSDEFNMLVGVTKQAEKAAGDALEAADIALEAADSVKARADSGEFNGDKGDTGPDGPQGVSGVYVGSGDMPEGYSVQVDPAGDMPCYTAGESDDRYANVLTGTASGPVAGMEDVSPTGALRRAAVLGATTETGEGDKGPDNPYAIAGVQPTKITVCGKNLLPSNATSGTANGLTRTVDENGIIRLSGAATGTAYVAVLSNNGTPHVWLNEKVYRAAEETKSMVLKVVREDGTEAWSNTNTGNNMAIANQVPCGILQASYEFAAGAPDVNTLYPYLGLEANQPYQPYTGQTITLPTLAPLYGDGTVNDEYDAASGIETRRWGKLVFDGTESNWTMYGASGQAKMYLGTSAYKVGATAVCTHYLYSQYISGAWMADRFGTHPTASAIVFDTNGIDTLDSWKAYLAAQAAAGTPVTVLYQLAAPVVTRHDPARLLPPAPACRVFADAGSVDVGYNRDVNIVVAKLEAALANQAIMLEGDE